MKQNATHVRPVEELCRRGYLRYLTWNLVSEKGPVRAEAARLFSIIHDLSKNNQGDIGVDLWAAIVEQGLVTILELVRVGFPVRPFLSAPQAYQRRAWCAFSLSNTSATFPATY